MSICEPWVQSTANLHRRCFMWVFSLFTCWLITRGSIDPLKSGHQKHLTHSSSQQICTGCSSASLMPSSLWHLARTAFKSRVASGVILGYNVYKTNWYRLSMLHVFEHIPSCSDYRKLMTDCVSLMHYELMQCQGQDLVAHSDHLFEASPLHTPANEVSCTPELTHSLPPQQMIPGHTAYQHHFQ